MCGICGVIGGGRGEQVEPRVSEMLRRLEHRGPDEEGILSRPGALLGMRRLSIIDLGGGSQPVFNEDGLIGIVFNGEIYNFPELRAQLEGLGHQFRTHSDTEVIVHAYEEWGPGCPAHLRGMFAFAIWDGREAKSSGNGSGKTTVFLARDRLGIKPLYYAAVQGAVFFASEVRALLASGAIPRRISRESVEAYLLFGSVVEPMTLIEGVFSLPPGHSMLVRCEGPGAPEPKSYWDFAACVRGAAPRVGITLREAGKQVRPLLEHAVRSHLIADVPLGCFLSSGLDSTALVALASRERSGLHTFTVAFDQQEFSEAIVARETAKRFGTEHRELVVTSEQMGSRLEEAIGALDQPSMDGVNTFFVSWAARQVGLKVALSGLGGDEVFAGGYPTFRSTPRVARMAAVARRMPSVVRGGIANLMASMARTSGRSDALRKVAAVWRNPKALPHPYFFTRTVFTPRKVDLMLGKRRNGGVSGEGTVWRAWLERSAGEAVQLEGGDSAVSWLEMRTYMLDTLLRDTDSMSMHHSLEVRVPLLDHPLVEYAAALPDSVKRGSTSKALLVEAVADLLPEQVMRQPKRTFTFPWENWLHGPLGLQVASRLGNLTPSLAAIVDGPTVETIWKSFLAARTGWSRPWSIFVLNEWIRRHVDEVEVAPQRARSAVSAPGAVAS